MTRHLLIAFTVFAFYSASSESQAGIDEVLEIANECDFIYCGHGAPNDDDFVRTGAGINWYIKSEPPLRERPQTEGQGSRAGAETEAQERSDISDAYERISGYIDPEGVVGEASAVGTESQASELLSSASTDTQGRYPGQQPQGAPEGQQQQGIPPEQQQRQQPAAGGGQQPGQMGAAGQGGMGASTGLPNMAPNNRHNLKAGFLYRDDAPSAPSQNPQNGNSTVTPTPHMTNTSPNQDANAQASSGRDQKREDPRGAAMMGAGMMAGQSPNMTGSQFDGQNPRRQQGAPDGHEADGALSKIAKKLGMGGFFGASGSGGTSRQRAANPTQGSAGKRQDPAISKKASELRARKLLQAQFNKLKGHRQLASELEFGSSNSSLFVNMCHHYARYARQHQLPINYAGCPKP